MVRNTFSLANIQGVLTKLDVRCANKRHVFTLDDKSTWEIPESWQRCSVYVYGEVNAAFEFIEHPFKTNMPNKENTLAKTSQ